VTLAVLALAFPFAAARASVETAAPVEEGIVSWYGESFHERPTASGELFDATAMTMAHPKLPFGTKVKVTNLRNGRSVVVRVNDRGPFHAGRIIDLSYAAAAKLGFIKQGTARVEVRALTPGEGRGDGVAAARRPAEARPVATVEDNAVAADEFERWMRERGIRFASGTSTAGTSTVAEAPTGSTPAEGDVLLQLAAFSARDNAERARERLVAGGVEPLRIDEAIVNGQPVWRLRIGPVPSARAQELSVRAADLGFGQVQIVRD
jgi:rare lipoprotein A